ncbi:MAG TPA: hypothetical protein VFH17_03780 [Coriobacteriia bacterium]|nr:hypothetical protein [Coriobacteriia bacterium]
MATVTEWRTEIQTRLSTVVGQRAYAVWPRQISTPAAIVRFVDGTPADMSDGWDYRFDVLLFARLFDDISRGSAELDEYLPGGQNDVTAALGGDAVEVESIGEYGTHEANGTQYMGMRVRVKVLE